MSGESAFAQRREALPATACGLGCADVARAAIPMASVFRSVKPPLEASGTATPATCVFGSVRPLAGVSPPVGSMDTATLGSVFGSLRPPLSAQTAAAPTAAAPARSSFFGSLRPPLSAAQASPINAPESRLNAARPAHLHLASTSISSSGEQLGAAQSRPPPTKNKISGLFSQPTDGKVPLIRSISGSIVQGEDGIITALEASLEDLKSTGAANAASTITNLALRPEIQDALRHFLICFCIISYLMYF
jgi:hypothetical protein